jgi:Xaa-Pro dipeptidase
VSLYGGWPTILGRGFFDENSEDGEVTPGMTLCVESYIGEVGGPDGVKLEEQVLVTESGYRLLSDYPFETTLLG